MDTVSPGMVEANRVSEGLAPPHVWRYVPSADNPADAATRGVKRSATKHKQIALLTDVNCTMLEDA